MPRVYTEPFKVGGWEGSRIGCGALKIVLVPSLGGRIISLRYEGREFLFSDKEHLGETFEFPADIDLAARKRELGFRLWGGDKTWVAPQNEWLEKTPPLELDAGNYALTWEDKTAVMTSPVCRETGLRIVRKVHIDEEQTVHLSEEFQNTTADKVIRKGIWNVTQVARPCTFFIPANKGTFRSYHQDDPTLPQVEDIFREADGWVEVPCRTPTLFKCGGIPNEGQVLVRMPLGGPKELVWLKTFTLDVHAQYAHGSAVEVFNSDRLNYAEVEIHAPLVSLDPGASCRFEQQWRFRKM